MFCWPCITVYEYSEANVMHFSFNSKELRASTCFERYLLIFRRRCSWLQQDWSSIPILVQTTDITRTQYTTCRLCRASWRWASNARNMLISLILNNFIFIFIFIFISLPECYNLSAWHSAAVVSVLTIACRGSAKRRILYWIKIISLCFHYTDVNYCAAVQRCHLVGHGHEFLQSKWLTF
jgi:hypothetical protein